MNKTIPLLLCIAALFSGCVTTPEVVVYNGRTLPTVSLLSIECDEPYELTQDCGSLMGAKRKVQLGDQIVHVAGSADGTVILMMGEKRLRFDNENMTAAGAALEALIADNGLTLLETTAGAAVADGEAAIGALFFVTDGDAYSLLKPLTIED